MWSTHMRLNGLCITGILTIKKILFCVKSIKHKGTKKEIYIMNSRLMFDDNFKANPKKDEVCVLCQAGLASAGRDVRTDRETPNTNISR